MAYTRAAAFFVWSHTGRSRGQLFVITGKGLHSSSGQVRRLLPEAHFVVGLCRWLTFLCFLLLRLPEPSVAGREKRAPG